MTKIRNEIKAYYGGIAGRISNRTKASCCSGASCCGGATNSPLYPKDLTAGLPADSIIASLGCANPIVLANLQKGETVLDLGSGGGIDAFISAKLVGDSGKVYGLDMTDEMLELANRNMERSGIDNVEFIKGYIEDIPLESESVDVVMSNCVINLSESKQSTVREAYRVLKRGGRLAIADIVQLKDVSEQIRENIGLWVGCIAGALTVHEYRTILMEAGFNSIEITPVNIYTSDFIQDIALTREEGDIYAQLAEMDLDAAFAGAHIKAYK